MVSTQILKRNQQLEEEAKQLADLCKNLLSENRGKCDEIEKLKLEQTETDNEIFGIYILLCSEVIEKNDILHMQADSENMGGVLDNTRILIKILLHENDSFERENEYLEKLIQGIG